MSTIAAIVLGIGGMTILGVVLTARSGDLRWLFLGLPISIFLAPTPSALGQMMTAPADGGDAVRP